MLNKKQYFMTLGASIVVFFVIFIAAYFISFSTSDNLVLPAQKIAIEKQRSETENSITKLKLENTQKEVAILPSTKVTLALKDTQNNQIESVILDTATLLGNTKEAIQNRFDNYAIETFSEDEVTLIRTVELDHAQVNNQDDIYVLGIDDNRLCIKIKSTDVVCGYIDRELTDLSSYLYSEFLKENITITDVEREKLLVDGGFLQIILQDYESE